MDILIIIATVVMSIATLTFAFYRMSEHDIFFTRVPEGEIIAVMHSDKLERFIANIDGFWVHPKTGEVFDKKNNPIPTDGSVSLPEDLFDSGIYWLGIWPFAERYTYDFHWNKWTKQKDEKTGKEKSEYSIVSRSEKVKSLYFKAQYPVLASGCETSEGVPLTMIVLVTTETVNADIALFKIKTPGWLSALNGQITAIVRDWNGKCEVSDIAKLQAEIPTTGAEKSEFQKAFLLLNETGVGNPSVKEMYGQKIVAVSFVSYSIDDPTNPLQEASIKKYQAEREKEVTIIKAKAKNQAATEDAKATIKNANADAYKKIKEGEAEAEATRKTGAAEAEIIALKGTAEAEASRKMSDAVKNNPYAGTIAVARAIENQKHATTLIVGKGVLPTKNV